MTSKVVTKVMLVDDHAMVRRGLGSFLSEIPDIEVVAEADDGLTALQELKRLAELDSLPDVVLMDLVMPQMDGVAATAEITAFYDMAVIVITTFGEAERVLAAMKAGASGYLLKSTELDQLVAAIRGVRNEGTYLDPLVAGTISSAAQGRGASSLTRREREVLVLLAEGLANRQIASTLVISERTASTHVSRIFAKIGVNSRTQAALWARSQGLTAVSDTADQVTG